MNRTEARLAEDARRSRAEVRWSLVQIALAALFAILIAFGQA